MIRSLVVLLLAVACGKAVKHEGFKAGVTDADDVALEGRFEALGQPSCGMVTAERRELRLQADGFAMKVLDEPFSGKPRQVEVTVQGQRFVSDRQGAESHLVVDMPRGRIIGSLTARLVHESAGTTVDGRPAPVRELSVDVTFNLQPCL